MSEKAIPAVVLACFGIFVTPGSAQHTASDPPISVELSSPQDHYLLGEPVSLKVAITNKTEKPLQMLEVLVENVEPEIEVYISGAGTAYHRWTTGILPAGEVERQFQLLGPGEPKHYILPVVYRSSHPSHLAFPNAGKYQVRVRFPLVLAGRDIRMEIHSNSIVVHIEHPRNHALKMWEEINDDRFRVFMQTGGASKNVALKAASLVKSHGYTPYHDDLRSGLREFYRNRHRELSEHEAQLIRDVTGIKEKKREKPFANDDRLDEADTYEFPYDTLYTEVFQKINHQSRVPLDVHADLRNQMLASLRITQPLREFMRSRAVESTARWIPKGKGYMLVPLDHAEQQEE